MTNRMQMKSRLITILIFLLINFSFAITPNPILHIKLLNIHSYEIFEHLSYPFYKPIKYCCQEFIFFAQFFSIKIGYLLSSIIAVLPFKKEDVQGNYSLGNILLDLAKCVLNSMIKIFHDLCRLVVKLSGQQNHYLRLLSVSKRIFLTDCMSLI